MEDDPQTVQRRCRLCLHSEPTDQSGDVFPADQELPRQLLKFLKLDHDLAILPVCRGCVQTIQLFEEFGELCRRTDKLFREAEVLPWDKWDGYREHVTASVTLVQSRRDDLEWFAEARRESVEIKEERGHGVYLEECEISLVSVDIKEEKSEGTDFEDALDREEGQQTDQKQGEFLEKRLQVARTLNAQLELLESDKVSHHKIPWNTVREQLGWELDEVKRIWESTKRWYQRKLRVDDVTDEGRLLFEIVQSLLNRLNQPAQPPAKKRKERKRELDTERRLDLDEKLELVELIHEHEFLWNTKHTDYQNQAKRVESWNQLASHFEIRPENIRKEWRYLRDIYRTRLNRTGGPIQERNDPRDVQLFQLLEGMLRDNCQVGLKSAKRMAQPPADTSTHSEEHPDRGISVKRNVTERKPTFGKERRLDLDEKLKLAALIHEQEFLWNTQHIDYHNQQKRAETWDLVTSHFDTNTESIRKEWHNLRDLYRGRCKRVGGPIHDCDDPRDTPLFQLLDGMLRNNCQWGVRSAKALTQQAEASYDWKRRIPADSTIRSEEQRLELADEIGRHAVIWDAKHPDCGNAVKRGEAWNSIAAKFNCTKRVLQNEWSRFVQRLDQARRSEDAESFLADPLHRRMHQLLTERGSTSVADDEEVTLPRRRFTGKRSFDPEGCIKLTDANGVARYYKVCELCGKEVERSLFEVHMNQHNGLTPYACSYEGCEKRYGNKTTRDRHEIAKHGSEGRLKIECQECGERFFHRSQYEYHYAVKHKSEEIPCDICGKRLKHKNLLQPHIRKAHHTKFECVTCGKFYQSKYALDTHNRIHTNEKPFVCFCGERFRIKVLKKRHLANVHNLQLEELEAAMERN